LGNAKYESVSDTRVLGDNNNSLTFAGQNPCLAGANPRPKKSWPMSRNPALTGVVKADLDG
jgi:hypothetical protein